MHSKRSTRRGTRMIRLLATTALLLGLVLSVAPRVYVRADPATTTIYRVKPGGSTGDTCGTSWPDACSLQKALSLADGLDEIWVAAGTYKPTAGSDRTVYFTLKSGVALYGGFTGTEGSRGDRNWNTNVTTLSGDIGTVGDASDNSYHVVYAENVGATAILDGFTITGGNASGGNGGGLRVWNGVGPTLANLIVSNNSANSGGGMSVRGSTPHLTNVAFSNNTASLGGGVDYSSQLGGLTLSLTGGTFSGNQAWSDGGGLRIIDGSVTLRDVHFTNNTAGGSGGGIYSSRGTLDLDDASFEGNRSSATSGDSGGGGLCNEAGTATLDNVTFTANMATGDGGGLSAVSGDYGDGHVPAQVTLVGVTFERNSGYDGGGLFTGGQGGSSATLHNATFHGNTAANGGGVCAIYGGTLTMSNVVLSGNQARSLGGGICANGPICNLTNLTIAGNRAYYSTGVSTSGNYGGAYVTAGTLTNSIVWGNTARFVSQLGGDVTASYSLVQGGYAGTGNVGDDPLFVRNPSPGADGNWDGVDDDYGDLHLRSTSPAIDAGDNAAAVAAGLTADLGGGARFLDHTRVDTGAGTPPIVDMGVYEAGANTAPMLDNSGSPALGIVIQGGTNAGTLVSALIASVAPLDMITDPDLGAVEGIAITGADTAHGTWQVSTNGGGSWTDVGVVSDAAAVLLAGGANDRIRFVPAAGYSGLLNPALTFRAWDRADGRASGASGVDVSANGGNTAYSSASETASIRVATPPAVTTHPLDQAACAGASVSFTAAASGDPAPSVQWQVTTDNGRTLADIPGATSPTLTFAADASQHGYRYRAVFTNVAGTAESNGAGLTVNTAPSITAQPASKAAVYGERVTFTAAASGRPVPTVHWEVSTDSGITWHDIAGATSTNYCLTATPAEDGNLYLAIFTNGCGSAASDPATLTVSKAGTMTTITGHSPEPSNAGQAVTVAFSVAAAAPGSGTPTGSVTVSDGVASCTGTVADGGCSLTLSTQGDRTLTATYAGDGSFFGSSGTATHRVASPPTADAGGPYSGDEGSPISLSGAGTDLPGEALSYSWAFGDGATSAGQSLSHTYNDDGTYSATLTVTDDRGASGTDTAIVTIRDVLPSVTAPANQAADEGVATSFSLGAFADPGADAPWAAHVDWGDGSSDLIPGLAAAGALPNRTHVYGRDGSYTVTVRISDKDGAAGTTTFAVAVAEVPLALGGQFDQAAREGTLTTFSLGSLVDSDVDGPWSLSVDWGDGLRSTFSVAATGALTANHLYDDDGTYTVTVQASDRHGASDSQSFNAIVRNVAPKVRIDPRVTPGVAGTQVGLWAQASDPSRADTRAGFDYQWSLRRDGVEIGTGSASSLGFDIPAGDTALYEANLTVRDKDGGVGYTSWHMRGETRAAVDARIQVLWPHGGAAVRDASLANLSAWLLEPGTLRPAQLSGDPAVYLWRALNNEPGEVVARGVRRGSSMLYDFNNVDVSAARDARNKLYFYISVEGVPTRSNVWAHAQDARTRFPAQDVPTGTGPVGGAVDARIEILWPHGNARVTAARQANLTALLCLPGTLTSVPAEWSPTVRLYRALDNGVAEQVAIGVKRLVTRNGITCPVWDFDNVDVSAAQGPAHKLFFSLAVDGVEAHTNVWLHGVDGRTIFPQWDAVE